MGKKNNEIKKTFLRRLKRTGSFSLTQNEKLYSKEELIHFMQKHPVRNPDEARHQLQKARTAFVPLQLIYSMKPMTALMVLALIFGLGGGTSFAANDSLPGDTLYPVKIHVNERVESILAFSEEAEAEFNLEKAEVRLQEAENLAVENKGSAKALAKVEARFDKHIEKTERLAAKMETKGKEAKAAEINARLEAMLEVHSRILVLLQERLGAEAGVETENDSEEFGEFVAKIKIKATASEEETEEGDNEGERSNGDEGPSMQAALNAEALAKKHLERITRFADKRGAKATAELSAEAKSHLNAAEVLIAEGEAHLDAENYAGAFASFHEAHKHIQRANSIIASSASVGLKLGAEKRNPGGNETNKEETEEGDNEGEENDENNEEENIEVETETEVETEAQLNISGTHVKTDANFMQRVWSRF